MDVDRIAVSGFSAGGHLACCLGVFWDREWLYGALGVKPEMIRPDGMILCYPVITSDPKYAHTPSFQNLLGDTVEEEAWNLSLNHQITDSMPPCFIWHTATDQTVPLPNSLLLAWHYGKQAFRWSCMCIRKGFMDSALPMTGRMSGWQGCTGGMYKLDFAC